MSRKAIVIIDEDALNTPHALVNEIRHRFNHLTASGGAYHNGSATVANTIAVYDEDKAKVRCEFKSELV